MNGDLVTRARRGNALGALSALENIVGVAECLRLFVI